MAFVKPPVVTIMGHVDHGKTTLLDTLRQSRVTESEAGGITQHIGAYQVNVHGQAVTFIDTPGHAAFSQMRQRGASLTDIVILVVAANDGVKPQTIESIKHIQAAQVPFVVAINKCDLPDSSPDTVKAQLTEHQVFVEGYGGQTPVVEISAIKGTNIDQLLELIILVSQLEEVSADPTAPLEAIVIESQVSKKQGPLATLIIQQGTLSQGSTVYVNQDVHKIRAMFNDLGKPIKQAEPGDPVQVMGFKSAPPVGQIITDQPTAQTAQVSRQLSLAEEHEGPFLKLILKADAAGTLEAVRNSAESDSIVIIDQGVGPITESDVLMAQTTGARIIGFSVPVTKSAEQLAQIEKIKINTFTIIYKLLEYLERRTKALVEPAIIEEEIGLAVVKAVFNMRGQTIAGCLVTSGKMDIKFPVHVSMLRNTETSIPDSKDAKIVSLKRGKEDAAIVKHPDECGIVLQPTLDLKEGDVIKCYRVIDD